MQSPIPKVMDFPKFTMLFLFSENYIENSFLKKFSSKIPRWVKLTKTVAHYVLLCTFTALEKSETMIQMKTFRN